MVKHKEIRLPSLKLLEEIDEVLPCKSRIKKWAFENAYTLILMSALFAITWGVMLIYGVTHAVK